MKNRYQDLSDALIDLEEAIGASPSIDQENGVVRGVVILTGNKVSGNRTKYLDSALNEAAERYNGAKMYLDHPLKEELAQRRGNRSVRDLAGVYKNVRREGPKVVGDLHVMEHHRAMVLGIAKVRPKGTGLSIRDQGRVREDSDGTLLVEGFKKGASYSVDLVTEASVNEDLFESKPEGGDTPMDKELLKKLTLQELTEARPDLVEAVKASAKAELAKDIEEAAAKGQKAEAMVLQARKLDLLCQAGFSKELHEAVKSSVMPGAITLEEATTIVNTWKDTAAKLQPKPQGNSNADPQVTGHGSERKDFEEGKELPSDDAFVVAFGRRS